MFLTNLGAVTVQLWFVLDSLILEATEKVGGATAFDCTHAMFVSAVCCWCLPLLLATQMLLLTWVHVCHLPVSTVLAYSLQQLPVER